MEVTVSCRRSSSNTRINIRITITNNSITNSMTTLTIIATANGGREEGRLRSQ